ncbi:MAG: HAD family hydrolase [Candidatus Cloacimonetes bacterium]|nr:HAD family hydrolase [Candidatus Cloacimonadota bacterium]
MNMFSLSQTHLKPDRRLCVTDLDGTLLGSDRKISTSNLETLHLLGEQEIVRVLATGRSLWSLSRVVPDDAPLDFIIFATGAGIMDWRTKQLLYSANLNSAEIQFLYSILDPLDCDFMIHFPVPDTHYLYYRPKKGHSDFWDRISYYREFSQELDPEILGSIEASTQFLLITEKHNEAIYKDLEKKLAPLTVIRTTSPMDLSSLWIEIFPERVSKGKSLKLLAERLSADLNHSMVIGNDFNDADMLALCPNAFVTGNAAGELKARYLSVSHHDEDGFTEAVKRFFRF